MNEPNHSDQLANAVYQEYLQRIAAGTPADFARLCAQHPQLAQQLAKLDSNHESAAIPTKVVRPEPDAAGPASPENQSPQSPSRYASLQPFAKGGMGVIYKVWDLRLHRELAMKLIRDEKTSSPAGPASQIDPETMARFVREAEITARLDHPGVVPIHDMGTDEQGRVYFTMRLIQGERLDDVFNKERNQTDRWTQTRVLDVIVKICETVAFAHSRGVIHRDLKPSNIMVGQFGETYVMDWGLAKNLHSQQKDENEAPSIDLETIVYRPQESGSEIGSSTLLRLPESDLQTQAGAVMGTASYMPPEQAAGRISELDERSDIYSVGAILYEQLAGRRPYSEPGQPAKRTPEILTAVIAGPPEPINSVNRKVAPELVAICEKAMQRRQADRYQSMAEMAEDLRAYLENRVVRAHQTGAVAELKKWVSRNRWTAIASATGGSIALILLLTVVALQSASNKSLSQKNIEISQANQRIRNETTAKEQALIKETEARQRADDQLARAEGLILARSSTDMIATNPTKSLQMAIESARRHPSDAANTAALAALAEFHEDRVLKEHQGAIRTADVSPDGLRLVTAGDDRTAIVWNLANGDPLLRLQGHENLIIVAKFSPDGTRIATGSFDRTARLWDARTGKLIAKLDGNEQPVRYLSFHPLGGRLITSSRGLSARIYDAESGALASEIANQSAPIVTAAYSPNGKQVVTSADDGTVRLWDATTGMEQFSLALPPDEGITSVHFSGDGNTLLTMPSLIPSANKPNPDTAESSDRRRPPTVRLWNSTDGQLRFELRHSMRIKTAIFSHGGQHVLIGGFDGTVIICSTTTGEVVRSLDAHGSEVESLAFNADDSMIAVATRAGIVHLWDLTGVYETSLLGHTGDVRTINFFSGEKIVTTSEDATVRFWNVRPPGKVIAVESGDEYTTIVEVASDQSRLLVAPIPSRKVALATFPDGRRIAVLQHDSIVNVARFSPDGAFVVTKSKSGIIHLFSAVDGRKLKTIDRPAQIDEFTFDQDSRLLAASFASGEIAVWNLLTQTLEFEKSFGNAKTISLSPRGDRIVALSEDSAEMTLWSLHSDTPISIIPPIATGTNYSPRAEFSKNGEILATWSLFQPSLKVWEAKEGKLLATFDALAKPVIRSSFSGDCRLIAIGYLQGAAPAEIWEVPTGRQLHRLSQVESPADAVLIDPTGSRLWSRSIDRSTHLWNCETGEHLRTLSDPVENVRTAVFSSNGRLLLTSSGKRENVVLWNPVDAARLATIPATGKLLSSGSSSMAFSADGRWFATGYSDGSATIWPIDPIDFARTRLRYDLAENDEHTSQSAQPDSSIRQTKLR